MEKHIEFNMDIDLDINATALLFTHLILVTLTFSMVEYNLFMDDRIEIRYFHTITGVNILIRFLI